MTTSAANTANAGNNISKGVMSKPMQDGRLSAFGTFRTPTGQHLRGWGERRHTIARQSTRPGGPVTCWRDRIDCPNVTGAGTGSFELEAASGD